MKTNIAMKDRFITAGLAIYPEFNCGLEIECGNGLRIGAARRKNINLWGLGEKEYPEWCQLGIDPFIKVGSVFDIPYPDEFFDFVVYYSNLGDISNENDRNLAINEITRVGNDRFFLKASTKKNSQEYWLDYILKHGLYPEVFIENIGGIIDMELRKNFL